jgi:hypothetical protein
VYVTWRAESRKAWPAALSGVAIAVEFLPADFVP